MSNTRYKVALVNPPFSKLVYGDEYTIKSITPCLGLFYLESYCRDIADFKIFEGEFYSSMEHLIEEINNYDPDVLAVTTNTSTYPLCVQLAQETNAKFKFVGGPYSSYRLEEGLEDFTAVFIGDAEVGMREFLSGKPLEEVSGIAFIDNSGKMKRNANAPLLPLDDFPFPNHSAMQIGLYQASPHREMETPFATMMTTRGCGFKCTFCLSAVGGMNNGKYRERSVKNVMDEIEILTKQFGVKSIQFWDDTWTMRKERTKEMCKAISKFNITYVINTRTDKMDDEIAEWLVNSGCRGVFFGVESGDQEMLDSNIKKGVRNEQVMKAVSACKKVNLQSTASFIFGSIDDTRESIKESIDFSLQLDADFVLYNIYTAHPGTAGFDRALREGVISDFKVDIEKYKGEPVGVPTICKNLTREELHILKAEAYIKYYTQKDAEFYRGIIQTYVDEVASLKSQIMN
jgi:anaerobic magnesium-protoporphyrin IX monomethyl ester cyclase